MKLSKEAHALHIIKSMQGGNFSLYKTMIENGKEVIEILKKELSNQREKLVKMEGKTYSNSGYDCHPMLFERQKGFIFGILRAIDCIRENTKN